MSKYAWCVCVMYTVYPSALVTSADGHRVSAPWGNKMLASGFPG